MLILSGEHVQPTSGLRFITVVGTISPPNMVRRACFTCKLYWQVLEGVQSNRISFQINWRLTRVPVPAPEFIFRR
jgi:hypothetical protein